ncbi:apoptotic chromatin condensation inducer in the nucleus [Brassica rapa]|uniref:SAP domain-containing protein n=1 Tax=Brassica campestris TaxID=3711 RepID=M4D2G8_BRACM|nr:apoptotic chromatin condensation inducer in the nucleus [Brassica rapa]XP_018509300.1 apoptotic chromatin condensation inducer in the nucleus [Brassica rapa]XP_033132993.1 apoptotic chromatin condensation inducer in the nucleus [Brassica rapa]
MSSSPFPILDNRPIDKWKVTELKEELKRRRLTTQGLKVDLVRRLDDALRAEQQESQSLNTAATVAANQQAEITNATGGNVTPDRMQTTPSAAETTPEPTVVKTTTEASAAIEITPPPVVSKPEVNAGDLDDVREVAGLDSSVVDDAKLQEPEVADVKDGVGSGVTATDAIVADEASNKPQPTDSELEKAATDNQVSVTGYEVKSDCISTDSVPTNEKMDNEIAADDVKLEQNVSKSQEPSTVIGESHPMDVEKVSVGGGDVSDAANAADMTKGNNNNIDAGDSEKLNLDRSSGDESMEDEPESKQTESVTSHQVVDKSEKNDIVDAGKGEAPENKSHPLVASDKRKLPGNDQEAVGNNEPVKRQRRWNSGSVKVPEAQATNSVAPPTTTPKSTGLKRDFSRSDSSVSEDGPKERVVPPSSKEPTDSLRIDRFLRPFTLKAVQELLGKTGNVTSFWMDSIKTHCYVSYSSVEEAAATREAVYNLQWPTNGGRLLTAEFVGSEEVKAKLESPPQAKPPQPQAQAPSRPPATTLPPPPPLAKAPPVIERLPPPPPLVAEEQEAPIVTLDDLFKKTKAIPRIYYLPLSEDQVAAKLAANNK